MPENNKYPLVSLLVAVHNEADYIKGCLQSIIDQDYPKEYLEVIILDGLSQDASFQIAEDFCKGRNNYKLLINPLVIQSSAWNSGVEKSQGEIISIVSGHVELAADYVSKAVETIRRTGADMVGGTVRAKNCGKLGETIALAISLPFGVGGARFRYTDREEETDSVFMGFCHRKVYQEIGGFDEEMIRNQDDEFSYRLLKAGGRIVCNPAIVSHYYNRVTLPGLWHQYFQYGYWKVRVVQKHPRQIRTRQFAPPVFVSALMISFFLSLFISWGVMSLFLIVGSYLLANITASIIAAAQKGWRHLPLLPVCFAILHLSYGIGFLMGLFKFWNRWGDKQGRVPGFSSSDV